MLIDILREKLIFICGPDGAGKTTLALTLATRYKKLGKYVTIRRIRGTHTLASIIARLLAKFENFRGNDIPFFNIRIPRLLRKIWLYLEVVSIAPHLLTYFFIYPLMGYIVILERSLIDFIVWVLFTLRSSKVLSNIFIRFLLLLNRKGISICLKADIKELLKRKKNESFLIYGMSGMYEILSIYTRCSIDTSKNSLKETYLEAIRCIKKSTKSG